MTVLKMTNLPNGNMLVLEKLESFVGMHGIPVFNIYCASEDGDEYHAVGSEPYLVEKEARIAFDNRLKSVDPSKPSRNHGGMYEIVEDAFRRYLGDGLLRSFSMPQDWEGFFTHAMDATFGCDNSLFNATQLRKALDGLATTSASYSSGRAEITVELPAWFLLQMITSIAALTMALHITDKPVSMLKTDQRAARIK